jgi:hypothetical protein
MGGSRGNDPKDDLDGGVTADVGWVRAEAARRSDGVLARAQGRLAGRVRSSRCTARGGRLGRWRAGCGSSGGASRVASIRFTSSSLRTVWSPASMRPSSSSVRSSRVRIGFARRRGACFREASAIPRTWAVRVMRVWLRVSSSLRISDIKLGLPSSLSICGRLSIGKRGADYVPAAPVSGAGTAT